MTVYLELRGGLANQLFMLATGIDLGMTGYDVVYDARVVELPGQRGISPPLLEQRLLKSSGLIGALNLRRSRIERIRLVLSLGARLRFRAPGHAREVPFTTYDELLRAVAEGGDCWVRGYLQAPDAGRWRELGVLEVVRQLLFATRMGAIGAPYAAVHVRRGDYVSVGRNTERLGVCTVSYFQKAISLLRADLPIVVVSDDPDWCEAHLHALDAQRLRIVTGNTPTDDLFLLAHGSQHVLSNSTFSWWGAILSESSTVIAPTPWFDSDDHGTGLKVDGWVYLDKLTGQPRP